MSPARHWKQVQSPRASHAEGKKKLHPNMDPNNLPESLGLGFLVLPIGRQVPFEPQATGRAVRGMHGAQEAPGLLSAAARAGEWQQKLGDALGSAGK